MEQSPSWKANRTSASQEIHRPSWDPKIHYHVHNKSPSLAPTLSQMNPIH